MKCPICKKIHNNKKFCSNKCKASGNSKRMKGMTAWNKGLGKGFIIFKGRKMIKKPKHHRAWSNGYVYEHILIMEKKLKRILKPNECVHHIDGNKSNNHPDNLQLMLHGEHSKFHWTSERRQEMSERIKLLRKNKHWVSHKN